MAAFGGSAAAVGRSPFEGGHVARSPVAPPLLASGTCPGVLAPP